MQAIVEGANRPTHIMHKSNLSWSVLRGFLRTLEQQDLVDVNKDRSRRSYALTEKGERVLKTYLSVKTQLSQFPPLIQTSQGLSPLTSLVSDES